MIDIVLFSYWTTEQQYTKQSRAVLRIIGKYILEFWSHPIILTTDHNMKFGSKILGETFSSFSTLFWFFIVKLLIIRSYVYTDFSMPFSYNKTLGFFNPYNETLGFLISTFRSASYSKTHINRVKYYLVWSPRKKVITLSFTDKQRRIHIFLFDLWVWVLSLPLPCLEWQKMVDGLVPLCLLGLPLWPAGEGSWEKKNLQPGFFWCCSSSMCYNPSQEQ